jgi:hypothetical protein
MSSQTNPANDEHDLVWGVANIARVINRSARQTYDLIDKGYVPAVKLGPKTIVASRAALLRCITQREALKQI